MYIQQLKISTPHHIQKGFTLIELMVSLLLGSLIAAAAFQVFYISQRTSTTQRSASSVQDSVVFGLNLLEKHLKLANIDADTFLNSQTTNGGLIISANNAPSLTDANTYTRQAVSATPSFTGQNSDQLTIQFKTPQAMRDCEGEQVAKDTQLIQRYYLRDGGLYCDSNMSPSAAPTFGGTNGVEIISGVDQFRVLFITDQGIRTPNQYTTAGTEAIHGVKLGFVFSGSSPTVESQNAPVSLFGQQLTLADGASNTIRRTYEPTILFRNARS